MVFVVSVLALVCQVQALSILRKDALTARPEPTQPFTLLSIEQAQVPGPVPAYVNYGDEDNKPQFTTFSNKSTACHACVEFWPTKEDGARFHQKKYEDPSGGVWDRTCRAGPCDFRDPQTDPVGGIIGKGVGPGGKPDGKTCITRDPVPWFSDCEPILEDTTASLLDATRYCSYKNQMFIPPPQGSVSRFGGKPHPWARIGGTNEQCLATIEREGAALFDGMTFCDSNLPALSGCCETVFSSLTCIAETTSAKTGVSQESVFAAMGESASQMLESFTKYCVPLCQNTKPEFCEKYPGTDICVEPKGCTDCTAKGGLWCPKLESCHCPSKNPPCLKPPITTPLQCLGAQDKGHRRRATAPAVEADKAKVAADDDNALCKYTEMARKWKPRI